jgi:hypothetical protein
MQDYLDPKLIQRLLRPIERPGVINTDMGWEIVRRSQKFTNRLPLISHLTQRWNHKIGFQGEQIPIVYARSQPQKTAETSTISAELSQSSTPQRTVVQAKFAPSVSNLSTVIPTQFPIQGEESQTKNSVGWVEARTLRFDPPNKTSALGFPISEPNLQSLSANPAQKNPTVETTSPNSQTTVVQAKFAPDVSHLSSLTPNSNPIQGEESKSAIPVVSPNKKRGSKTTNSVSWVLLPQPNNTSTLDFPIAEPKLQSLSANREQKNPILETPPNIQKTVVPAKFAPAVSNLATLTPRPYSIQGDESKSPSNQQIVVQAKFATASDRGILSPNPNPPDFSLETKPKSDDFKLEETIQKPQAKIQSSIDRSGLEIPLVFANSQANSESNKTELAVPNPAITGISRTEGMTQTAGLSQEVSPAIQSNPDRPDKANVQNSIDLEALTDKIERKLMQRLIVESERRGKNVWS